MIQLLMKDVGDDRRDGEAATNSVVVTWQVSFERIRDERPSAARLLSLMSLFDRQGIPRDPLPGYYGPNDNWDEYKENESENGFRTRTNTIRRLLSKLRSPRRKPRPSNAIAKHEKGKGRAQTTNPHDEGNGTSSRSHGSRENDTAIDDEKQDSDQFAEDVRTLCRYALITENKEPGTFEMHRLVQLVTIAWLKHKEEFEGWKEKYIDLMYRNLPTENSQNWRTAQDLIPHVERMLDYRPQRKRCIEQWGRVLSTAAFHVMLAGRFTWAERAYREAVNCTEGILGAKNPITLDLKCRLGWALLNLHTTTEAEILLRGTLNSMQEVLGQKDRNTKGCMRVLAETLRAQKQVGGSCASTSTGTCAKRKVAWSET